MAERSLNASWRAAEIAALQVQLEFARDYEDARVLHQVLSAFLDGDAHPYDVLKSASIAAACGLDAEAVKKRLDTLAGRGYLRAVRASPKAHAVFFPSRLLIESYLGHVDKSARLLGRRDLQPLVQPVGARTAESPPREIEEFREVRRFTGTARRYLEEIAAASHRRAGWRELLVTLDDEEVRTRLIHKGGWIPDRPPLLESWDADARLVRREGDVWSCPPRPEGGSPFASLPFHRQLAVAYPGLQGHNGETFALGGYEDGALTLVPGCYDEFIDRCERRTQRIGGELLQRTRASGFPEGSAADAIDVEEADLGSHAAVGVNTLLLTVSRPGGSSRAPAAHFYLHRRTGVAVAPDSYHVVPAGMFQPLLADADRGASIRLTFLRELGEELLGKDELEWRNLTRAQILDTPTMKGIDAALSAGPDARKATLHYLGLAVDPLNGQPQVLLASAMWKPWLDELLDKNRFVDNFEGRHFAVPFREDTVRAWLEHPRLLGIGAGALALAWKHREELLRPWS